MSITDELRECIRTANRSYEDARNPYNDREILHIPEEELLAIADRIDEQAAKMYEDLTIGMEPMTEDNMARDGWVKLPVDADGVPIHVGDELTNGEDLPSAVRCMALRDDGWTVASMDLRGFGIRPSTLRHVQPDSWEGIIADAEKLARGDNAAVMKLVERCRRLAERREAGS